MNKNTNLIKKKATALYVHIPFCNCICSYCDFYKMIAKKKTKETYIYYLVKELYQKKELLQDIKTIYIGGGSPSSLPLNLIDFMLYHINYLINMDKVVEFTFECNPMDITKKLCALLKKRKVNRVSIGVQSFNKEKLAILSRNYLNTERESSVSFFRRLHTKEDLQRVVRYLRLSGIKNINFDFIYGLGNEKIEDFIADLKTAISMGITHISTYSLIIEEKTILGMLYKMGQFAIMDPDYEYLFYTKIQQFLEKNGFSQYEISNFSKRKYQSKHNLTYWNNENYIGVGASASYYIDNVRFTNVFNLHEYIEGVKNNTPRYYEKTILSIKEQMNEEMMLGLRKVSGINLLKFKEKYNTDIFKQYPVINNFIKNKILKIKNNHLLITKRKLYISNEILVNFI